MSVTQGEVLQLQGARHIATRFSTLESCVELYTTGWDCTKMKKPSSFYLSQLRIVIDGSGGFAGKPWTAGQSVHKGAGTQAFLMMTGSALRPRSARLSLKGGRSVARRMSENRRNSASKAMRASSLANGAPKQ